MENEKLSLSEEIYNELVNGLKEGLDWTHFLAKHNNNKAALYSAIGCFFNDIEPQAIALNEIEGKIEQARNDLKSLNQQIKETGSTVSSLHERKNEITEEINELQSNLDKKKLNQENLKQRIVKLEDIINPLEQRRNELQKDIEKLSSKKETLEHEKASLQNETKYLRSNVANLKEMRQEIEQLQTKKLNLESEIGGREEELKRLEEIGFNERDLSRLRNLLQKIGEEEGISATVVKRKFFSALTLFGELPQLQGRREEEVKKVKALRREEASLRGGINALEERKAILEGEIREAISTGSSVIRKAAQQAGLQIGEAGSQLREEAKSISAELETLSGDILKAGIAVGQMIEMVSKGEKSRKDLERFIEDIRKRVGGT